MTENRVTRLFASRMQNLPASAIREICKLVARPGVKSLAGGWPDPAMFPVSEVRAIVADILTTVPGPVLQYGTTEGLPELRALLSERAKSEGLGLTPDNLLITHGSQQAMDLAAGVFIEPGDVALVGLPTYFGGTGAFCAAGAEPAGVLVDEGGIDADAMDTKIRELTSAGKRVKMAYIIPNFQNPDGSTLSLERRRRLVKLASHHNFILLEDDPYGALRYEGEALPSLKALDNEGRTILIRSFSKTISPGLRLAWVAAHPDVIRSMVILKQYRDSCTNSIAQYIVYEFLKRGLMEPHIQHLCAYYRAKRDRLLRALERHFPREVRWNRPEGGFFIWVTLPEPLDGEEILRQALDRNIAFVAGQPFFLDGSGRNTIRLSYSQSADEVIEASIAELGNVIRKASRSDRV